MPRKDRVIQEAPKVPPHSVDAEMGILGSMLISRDAISVTIENINEDYFHLPTHKTIYAEIVKLWEKGESIDLITFTQHLRDKKLLDKLGGASFVTNLFTFVPTPQNIGHYLEIVRDKYFLRQLITGCTKAVFEAYDDPEAVHDLIAETQLSISQLKPVDSNKKTLNDYVQDKLERMQSGEPDEDVIKTHLLDLDRHSPLKKGDMPLIVGEKKAGKSILALTILENICITNKLAGLYFSLESPASEVMDRIFAGVSRIPMNRHHVKHMTPEEQAQATKAAEKIGGANLVIRDDVYDLSSIIAAIRRAVSDNPDLALVVVDYAQLVRVSSKKDQTREREVATVSRAFRLLAMELKLPIILLSQLNKNNEARESKALEQDTTACWMVKKVDDGNKRKINIPYQRNGESGVSFDVAFRGNLGRMENIAAKKLEFEKK